ncbi:MULTISPECIES: hypothetical protein [Crateriforma]|uniref:Uncharacterized protein n=1 Tax=Crateriforma conspicua TaxID=2527996 RepID=A0A5C6FND0_9PLAN|nr:MULTISPECIES: hypothetical protein [Crateriforma]TWU62814.1 hypothetical protein V7x_45500 [Crateriforma conspicua]
MSDSSRLPVVDAMPGDQPASPVTGCCGGLRRLWFAGAALVAVAGVGAAFFAGRQSQSATVDLNSLPLIDATAAVASEDYSIATGPISDRAEGLFVLDHNSGLLQCHVIYPRLNQFMASFTANVNDALGTGGKGGKYIMVTGAANFQGSANQRLAPSVLYVLDTSTGNFVCFAVPFSQAMQNSRKPQTGTLIPLANGGASLVPDRDRLR